MRLFKVFFLIVPLVPILTIHTAEYEAHQVQAQARNACRALCGRALFIGGSLAAMAAAVGFPYNSLESLVYVPSAIGIYGSIISYRVLPNYPEVPCMKLVSVGMCSTLSAWSGSIIGMSTDLTPQGASFLGGASSMVGAIVGGCIACYID